MINSIKENIFLEKIKIIKKSFIISDQTIPVLIAYFRVVWQCIKISSKFCGWSANSQLYS